MQFSRCGPREQNPDFRPYAAEVIAPQQQDLLVNLLEFFQDQDVEVVGDLDAEIRVDLHRRRACAACRWSLHVPVNQHPQALRESFMDLCDDLNADGMLDPIKT